MSGMSSEEREMAAYRVVAAVCRHLVTGDRAAAVELLAGPDVLTTPAEGIDIVMVMSRLYLEQLIMMANGDMSKVLDVVDQMVNIGHGLPIVDPE